MLTHSFAAIRVRGCGVQEQERVVELRPTIGDYLVLLILLATVVGAVRLSLFVVETPAFKVAGLVYAGVGVALVVHRLLRLRVRSQG